MANPGGVGTKFVSVNLNKSYGSVSHNHHSPYGSNSYGQAAGARARPGSNVSGGGGGGGGGGGMVVLSRPRSSQKTAPKLSVPPPLNLPSLRKEHERFDVPGSAGVSAGAAGTGSGSRPSSSGIGWTKPAALGLQEKDLNSLGSSGRDTQVDGIDRGLDDVTKGSGGYVPPSARMGGGARGSVSSLATSVEKAAVLRGEDFPSLRAALPSNAAGSVQKQKDGSHKQKHVVSEGSLNEHIDSSLTSVSGMRPQGKSFDNSLGNSSSDIGAGSHELASSRRADDARKQEIFPSPLPLVQLRPRSDWADDERDTGQGFSDRGRDSGFPKNEPYWDGEFDMPRNSVLPHKPARNPLERWGKRDDEASKTSASEVSKVEPYRKEVRTPSREGREGNFWRNPPVQNNGFSTQEIANDRHGIGARPMGVNKEIGWDSKYNSSYTADTFRPGVTGNRESSFGRRDTGHGNEGGHQVENKVESFNSRRAEATARDRYGSQQQDRYRGNTLQDNVVSKSSFSSGSRGLPVNDPLLNFSKEKRVFSKDDPFLKDFSATGFDESDDYTGSLFGVIKKKKDVVKIVDFHDPVRESFEAELERVQKMQEQERQRIMEEQERAMEQARREEEERQRLIREEEEMRRKLEAEAREAAWREEQEQLEAVRMAEEQRIAREEEKQRIFMEEERRKQAAKQKLLELEARMAKRQAEAPRSNTSVVADGKASSLGMEKEFSSSLDIDNWEDSERMVERITTSGSTDPSSLRRPTNIASRSQPYTESSGFVDRGKPGTPWRMDAFGDGNSSPFLVQDQGNGHSSPRREVSVGGRAFPRKDFSGGAGYMSTRPYGRGGVQEPLMDDPPSSRGHSWNASGDGDIFRRNTDLDPEFYENHPEKIGDAGWGQVHSRSDPHSYPDRLYAEASELYPPGRSRHAMRQPRVLPPPVLASTQKASFRGELERPGPSSFVDSNTSYNNESTSDSSVNKWYYSAHPENFGASQKVVPEQETALIQEQNQDKTTPRCDSQSSLSVSSPPSSPTHLSHDDLDESGDSPVAPALTEGKEVKSSPNESGVVNVNSGKDTVMPASSSISAADEEDWILQNNEKLQEQEEYDEDVDGYQEDDEVHDGDDEQIDLTRELEDLQLEETNFSCTTDNLVLGFDEGVEVQIPDDDLERSSRNDEVAFALPELSPSNIKDQRPVDGIQGEKLCLQPSGTSPRICTESAPGKIQETEKAIHDSIVHTRNIDAMNGANSSIYPGESAQNAALSSVKVASGSSSIDPIVSSVPSQVDLPLNLQFGLFSGPTLLPTPFPAIQIGSIQMPLHLHPPIGSSLTHNIQQSQPPLFQFGQFRYTSPISQGVLPIGSQPMSFVQSNVQAHYHLNQSSGGVVPTQSSQDCSTGNPVKVGALASSVDQKVPEHNALMQNKQSEFSHAGEKKVIPERSSRSEDEGRQDSVVKNQKPSVGKPSGGHMHSGYAPSQSVWSGKDARGSKYQNRQPGINGNKFPYSARGSAPRSSFPGSEASRSDSSGFQRRPRRTIQRTEFRVRENVDRKLTSDLNSSADPCQGDDFVNKGKDMGKSGSKYEAVVNRPLKQSVEPDCSSSDVLSARGTDSKARTYRTNEKEASRTDNIQLTGEGNMKRNVSTTVEDVDAPLQSGVVCVFKQPGIEGPSDDDDFIEVRSKRQMLNDRRVQREKEIKAKSQLTKAPRKPRSTAKGAVASTSSNKISASVGGGPSNTRSKFVMPEKGSLANTEVSTGFPVTTSQPLAPIGTPAMSSDGKGDKRPQNIKSRQPGSTPVISGGGKSVAPGLTLENKNKILDNVQTSLGSWGSAQLSQQVMGLTQTQLDEAMKPGRYDTAVAPVENHPSSTAEPILPTPSILTKDKAFSSTASPINSLLAGEKIQFGAVTSPTVLPAASRTSTNGIGAPGSCRSEGQISHNISAAQSDCTLFFEKEKHQNNSHLEDCEAAAEAAASAVAVAAITNDEIVGSGLGTRAVPSSDAKTFSGSDREGINRGVAAGQQLPAQSREESLSVALPADLSVDTPPISLWPPLPSPQNSSSPMLSHFPAGAPSPFPFYEMNPMFGGPIFAFGPHDEAPGSQSQSQKSTSSASGPLGTWQQCHSSMDSFYGPPAGFAGPYVGPPGGIPGVQGPPHMVVYNHFPVGQFGQVGLSFMGTTYIPSGKQPDWKHNPTSAPMGISEGDMNNMNMVPQRNPLNMAGPVQHLAPGSPLLPIASPLAMFDVSPFQSAPDMSIQGRWSHLPASPLQSVPLSLPLQQQEGGLPPPQYSHRNPVDQSLPANRFSESRTSTPSESTRSFPVVAGSTATQLSDEIGLVNSSSSSGAGASSQSTVEKSSTGGTVADGGGGGGKTVAVQNVGGSNNTNHSTINPRSNQQQKNVPAQQYSHPSGYNNYQRGGMHQRNNNNNNNSNNSSGGDWSHRRMGFHGRNQMPGGEKGYPSSKVKQIYVAKQTTGGTSTTTG